MESLCFEDPLYCRQSINDYHVLSLVPWQAFKASDHTGPLSLVGQREPLSIDYICPVRRQVTRGLDLDLPCFELHTMGVYAVGVVW